MLYRLFIATEAGVQRLSNATAESTEALLALIESNAQVDDVIQVVLIEELAALDEFTTPTMVCVGSFASYFNGRGYAALMEIFHSAGQGLALHHELNRLAQEQARRTA